MTRVAIIGLGLIVGSLGLAIKAAGRSDLEVVGFDQDGSVRKRARQMKAVDETASDAADAARGAGLVIVATPPATVRTVFEEISGALGEGAAVTDVASTKVQVMEWAAELLPRSISFIGGHPMAGKTDQGIDNADASLFRDASYAVVPGPTARDSAIKSILGLIELLGAHERFMTAEEHDHYVGASSHLLIAASTALFTMLHTSESWADFAKIAGPAYKDLTRLASGDPEMSTDIAVTNRDQLQYWIDRYIVELRRFRDLLDESEDAIFMEFTNANMNRAKFMEGEDYDALPGTSPLAIPSSTDAMASLMMGPRVYERVREITKRLEDRMAEQVRESSNQR